MIVELPLDQPGKVGCVNATMECTDDVIHKAVVLVARTPRNRIPLDENTANVG